MDLDNSELGRFAQPALLILISLAGGPKHGYAMIEDIERLSGQRLGPGTLYGALARLERRRPYRLTATGAAALRDRLDSLRGVTTIGLQRLTST